MFHNHKFVGRFASPVLLSTLLLASCASNAQTQSKPFPFVIPWNDVAKTDVDVSFLNSQPAGANGFIRVRDGHFIEEKTGKRIRFVGVQMVAPECFPTHSDAQQVAKHMAKYGINLARLHYFDDMYDGPGVNGNIWDPTKPGHRHFDAMKLDRLDYFVNELKKNGIYVDMNLKAGRRFSSADGLNADVDKIDQKKFMNQGRVDFFDRDMIALQKEYAKMLLSHVNPYIGTAYKDEPAVFSVELNNENSLSIDYGGTTGVGLLQLPPYYVEELRGMWNVWLKQKYGTTAAVNAGWKAKAGGEFPELLKDTATLASWTPDNSQKPAAEMTKSEENGSTVFNIDVKQAGAALDSVQLKQDGLTLEKDHAYTLRFRAKGNRPVFLMCNDTSDWHVVGAWQPISITPEWKDYALTFNAVTPHEGKIRVGFAFGDNTGQVSLSNISLKEGFADAKLPEGETVEAGNIALTDNPTAEQKNDWVHFIADLEVGYAKEMRDYVKSLAPNTMVTCSQIGFGGLIGLYRERGMDYVDNHSYWDLPGPGGGVTNVSMVHYMNSMSNALAGLAKGRVAGKPYTISEYNHAWPNEYQAECMPLIGSIAGVQDWDMVNFHAYGPYASRAASGGAYGFGSDKISDNFDVGHNPAKIGFMPAMALMLRKGLIAPASGVDTHTLPANINNVDFVNMGPTATWTSHGDTGTIATDLFTKRWEVSFGGGQSSTPAGAGTATVNVTGITSSKQSGIFTTNSDGAKAVTGFVGGQTVNVGNASFGFNSGIPNNFAALTLTAMDGTSINTANKSLLTLASRAQNSGQTWNGVALDGNGNPIVDPVTGENFHLLGSIGGNQQVEIPQVHVVMPADGAREVHALNSTGGFGGIIPSTYNSTNHTLTFDIYPGYSTMWFTINKMPPVGMKVSGKDS